MGNFKWSVGDRVDAFFHDGYVGYCVCIPTLTPVIFISLFYLGVLMALSWREGEIKEIVEDGETKVKVFFSGRKCHIHHSMGFPLNLNAQMSILLPRGG